MASGQRQPKWAQSAAASTAAQYVEACVRCGSKASWQTAAGIAKHGVFALDFGACSHPAFAAACTFLREAPRGICEIQFLDSTRPLSRMMLFRTLARARSQAKGPQRMFQAQAGSAPAVGQRTCRLPRRTRISIGSPGLIELAARHGPSFLLESSFRGTFSQPWDGAAVAEPIGMPSEQSRLHFASGLLLRSCSLSWHNKEPILFTI